MSISIYIARRLTILPVAAAALCLAQACATGHGEAVVTSQSFRLGTPFGDHMVLQRGEKVPIWGADAPGQRIAITDGTHTWKTRTTESGKWLTKIGPFKSGGDPLTVTITGSQTEVLDDVLVGEVWLASGQSNMEFALSRSSEATQEIPLSGFPEIRLLKIPHDAALEPVDFAKNDGWSACTPESAATFSAVAYYFAKELHERLDVPVGVIQSTWGGTPMEAWTRLDAMKDDPRLSWTADNQPKQADTTKPPARKKAAATKATPGKNAPGRLYNGMINPLLPFKFRGVIWYQGEANVLRASDYRYLSEKMITDWRKQFGTDFPFLFVQLAGFEGKRPGWVEIMEAQQQTLEVPKTGMAIAADVGNRGNIHPTDKKTVGHRLALAARGLVYGENLVYSGPTLASAKKADRKAVLQFDHIGRGLVLKPDISSFELAGPDGAFHQATANLDGARVVVQSPEVSDPRSLRYAWKDYPDCSLYNAEGLPASPFRTSLGPDR